MLSYGLPQASPTKYLRARKLIDTKKLFVVRKAIKSQGMTRIEQMMPILAIVMGFLREYLSLMMPPAIADMKPKQHKLRAFRLANKALKPG